MAVWRRGLLGALTLWLAAAGAPAREPAAPPLQPEGSSGYAARAAATAQRQMVAAAHPLAAQAGLRMLQAGGSAIDAAIAAQMVLTLVEPQSSGIGGGAFLLYHDGRQTWAYDGRETAPAAADEALFLDAEGRPLDFATAVGSGRAVGTPGVLRLLALAHARHGRLPWAALFAPAIELAEQGYALSPRLHALLAQTPQLRQDPHAAALYFDPAGRPWPAGQRLRNPELAAVLRRIAAEGADAFYTGEIAAAIVRAVRTHPTQPGRLALDDLARYRAVERQPLCFEHPVAQAAAARRYRICGMPPPSSGTLAVGQILGLLQLAGAHGQAGAPSPLSADWLHLYAEAARLAFADRARYVADPDFVPQPGGAQGQALLAPSYLTQRARLIDAQRRMPEAPAGQPDPAQAPQALAPMPPQPERGTSHLSIVDGQGHVLAMTSSIEAAFGSRLMVNRGLGLPGGFLLNNQLTDFSFVPRDAAGTPVANRVQPHKRPRSSMTPVLVFDGASGQPLLSAGSPGGAYIIHYVARLLLGTLHAQLEPQQVIDQPNFAAFEQHVVLEQDRWPAATVQALRALGHAVREQPLTSGLQAIDLRGGLLRGGADPRREGVALGQ